jgi:hypothetical protein
MSDRLPALRARSEAMRPLVVAGVLLALLAVGAVVRVQTYEPRTVEEEAAAALATPYRANDVNPTMELRRRILTGAAFAGGGTGDRDAVRCVVMDWNIAGDQVATLVAVDDGSTSLYYSTGGGIIGAGEHEAVRRVASAWRAEAADERARFRPASDFAMPPDASIVFHLVTEGGTLSTVAIPTDALKAGTHPLSRLANRAQELIYRVREAGERQGGAARDRAT